MLHGLHPQPVGLTWGVGDDVYAWSERDGVMGRSKALPDTVNRADHGWLFFVDADIAASPRILTTPGLRLSTGKGLTEANPSPDRASDTVSGRVTRTPATASSLTGRTDPARAA